MIVSALFRTASTHFCYALSERLGLTFIDEVFDPLNEDILRMKRRNHEFTETLRTLDTKRFLDIESKVALWNDHSAYLINNHNYDIPWFQAAQIFYCRRDLQGALSSMHDLIVRSGQPSENIWIYADWMRRFVEYVLSCRGDRPLLIAENFGYRFRSSGSGSPDLIKKVYEKKISSKLGSQFQKLVESNHITMDELVSNYAKR